MQCGQNWIFVVFPMKNVFWGRCTTFLENSWTVFHTQALSTAEKVKEGFQGRASCCGGAGR
eukprot:6201838-Prorocentrum_lima.AAC.1